MRICFQVTDSITRQEQIIAEVQDLYQPFIQERGGSGGAREEALKSIASVRQIKYNSNISGAVLCIYKTFSGQILSKAVDVGGNECPV